MSRRLTLAGGFGSSLTERARERFRKWLWAPAPNVDEGIAAFAAVREAAAKRGPLDRGSQSIPPEADVDFDPFAPLEELLGEASSEVQAPALVDGG